MQTVFRHHPTGPGQVGLHSGAAPIEGKPEGGSFAATLGVAEERDLPDAANGGITPEPGLPPALTQVPWPMRQASDLNSPRIAAGDSGAVDASGGRPVALAASSVLSEADRGPPGKGLTGQPLVIPVPEGPPPGSLPARPDLAGPPTGDANAPLTRFGPELGLRGTTMEPRGDAAKSVWANPPVGAAVLPTTAPRPGEASDPTPQAGTSTASPPGRGHVDKAAVSPAETILRGRMAPLVPARAPDDQVASRLAPLPALPGQGSGDLPQSAPLLAFAPWFAKAPASVLSDLPAARLDGAPIIAQAEVEVAPDTDSFRLLTSPTVSGGGAGTVPLTNPYASTGVPVGLDALALAPMAESILPAEVLALADLPEGSAFAAATGGAASLVAPGPGLPAASLAHLIGQMAGALSQRREGVTDVALSPEELGRVQVTVQTDAHNPDRVVLFLTFDRPETLDLFRRNLDQLTEAMHAAGFAQAEIGLGSSGPDGGTGSGGRSPNEPPPQPDPLSALDRPSGGPATGRTDRAAALGSGLDLRL